MTRPARLISMATLLASSFFAAAAEQPALAGTCTVAPGAFALVSRVPSAGDFIFASSGGLTIPMDIDEATGTVTVHRAALPVVNVGTQGGPVDVHMTGADVTGSLDAAGNLSLPNFSVDTIFATTIELPTNPTLATGTQSIELNGKEFATSGVPLDFTTGLITLSGADIIPNAPIVSEPVIAGLRITCQLSPIPDAAKLPRPAALTKLRGKVAGGSLTLRATLAASRGTMDLKKDNVFVRIAAAGKDLVLLVSRAPQAGAAHRARTVFVLGGLPTPDSPQPTGSRVTIRGTRRKATVSIRIPSGLALSGVTGPVVAQVTIGSSVASAAAVADAGKLKTAH